MFYQGSQYQGSHKSGSVVATLRMKLQYSNSAHSQYYDSGVKTAVSYTGTMVFYRHTHTHTVCHSTRVERMKWNEVNCVRGSDLGMLVPSAPLLVRFAGSIGHFENSSWRGARICISLVN